MNKKHLLFRIFVTVGIAISLLTFSVDEIQAKKFSLELFTAPSKIENSLNILQAAGIRGALQSGENPQAQAQIEGAQDNSALFSNVGKTDLPVDLALVPHQIVWDDGRPFGPNNEQLVGNPFGDPLFNNQWHLHNIGQSGGTRGEDLNVLPVWEMGYSGNGVQIAIVEDGLQYDHPDLASGYVASTSYDYYGECPEPCDTPGINPDNDPYPLIISGEHEDDEGTPLAGIIGGRDNSSCGIGIAYRAGLSGIRLAVGSTTDAMEAAALSHMINDTGNGRNDIFSNSWGPQHGGWELRGPGPLTLAALQNGIENGRNGLGTIYLFTAGDGSEQQDNVNYDGYANSRYTIAVSAIDHNGHQAYYSEPGAPILVTSYGGSLDGHITTTDLLGEFGIEEGDCTVGLSGTSASTSMVAGVVALMLEANPNLSWRDVQYILAQSAVQNDVDDLGWVTNGAGYHVNHKYGFGRVDALAAVNRAKTWIPVPAVTTVSSPLLAVNQNLPDNGVAGVTSNISVTEEIVLEHVEVILNVGHERRGDLQVILTSPSGVQSILATPRPNDEGDDFDAWKFMTVHNWGEISSGVWSLTVIDTVSGFAGEFESWQLILHGYSDSEAPEIVSITRANSSPTKSDNVDFLINFSESVSDISLADFSLAATGTLNGVSLVDISGAGIQRRVTVNTGTGVGTLKLNVPNSATISDLAGNFAVELPYTAGDIYKVRIQSFADVALTHWAWEHIERLYDTRITGGCGSSPLVYCPDDTVTRAQMAVFLERGIHGSDYIPPNVPSTFGDTASNWAKNWIEALKNDGITGGCGGGNYCPESPVTRAQMAIFLLRAKYGASYAPPSVDGFTGFNDVPTGHWAAAWIKQLATEGITGGCGTNNYCPEDPVNRAQMAIFLVRTFNLP